MKASAKEGRAQESKVKEIATCDVLTDPITVEIQSDRPVKFLKDPNQIIPHHKIPAVIRDSVIADMGEEFFLSKDWTLGTLKKLNQAITHPRENITNTLAIICSIHCPLKDNCPFDIMGKAPTGERCPREKRLGDEIYAEYLNAVSTRLNIDGDDIKSDIIYHNLIAALVEVDIVRARLQSHIAHHGEVIDRVTAVNQETGEAYSVIEESPYMRMLERYEQKRDKLLRQLLATPEMAEKYRKKTPEDNHAKQIELLEQLVSKLGGALPGPTPTHIIPAEILDSVEE